MPDTRLRFLRMNSRLRAFFARHPVLRDVVLWALPALLVGGVLRVLMLSYLPYAFWGSDSRSYYSFAHQLLSSGYVSLDEKRRFLYPILMVPVSLLPGSPLRWLAVLQHALGLLTVLPVAYVARRTLVHWRLWIVPITVLFAGLPVILWYEHELLGECVFFAALAWAFGGWMAFAGEARTERARRLFWWFFVPFALFILTKPSGRFVWPGVFVGLVLIAAWRRLGKREITALLALMPITLAVGSKKQAAWLLYVAVFPLTQLQSPLHADYKAQIADLVAPLAENLDAYYLLDREPFEFLENPEEHPDRPLWARLGKDEKLKSRIYTDLALEAIRARPLMFLQFGIQRAVFSANLSTFGRDRFSAEYVKERAEKRYREAERVERGAVRMAYALPKRGPIPSFDEFLARLDPSPDSWRERFVQRWVDVVGTSLDFTTFPDVPRAERKFSLARPTFTGVWLALGALLVLLPRYVRTLGVWMLVAVAYAVGVFLVSQINARYFGPVWPVLIVLLAVPADVLVSLCLKPFRRS